jgi:bifunctional NMN adenylyltransferase/nudix hydrolase
MDKKYKVETRDVGVTCARFQLNELTPAHIELINIILQTHKRVLVVLGLRPLKFTTRNPLDFQMRKGMISETFGKNNNRITVVYLPDTKDDKTWCFNLDMLVAKYTKPLERIRYVGGRDSFLEQYKKFGNEKIECWEIKDFEQSEFISATKKRNEIAATTEFDARFRAGVIYTALNTPAKTVPTVDIAIINKKDGKVLIGKRHDEDEWRFIGVWSQPRETYEDAAHRAAREKANVEISTLRCRKSFCNFDWKFRGEIDDVTTMFYTAFYESGTPEPMANLSTLRWVDIYDINNYINEKADHYQIAKYLFDLHINMQLH